MASFQSLDATVHKNITSTHSYTQFLLSQINPICTINFFLGTLYVCNGGWILTVVRALLMPHSNAGSERVFSMVNKIDTEHRSELAQDTIAALLSVKVNCTADTHSYEPPATVLHMSKKATMNYNLPHRNTP